MLHPCWNIQGLPWWGFWAPVEGDILSWPLLCFSSVQASVFEMMVILGANIWSCLCCLSVLLFSFCCLFWFLECGGSVFPGRELSWDSARCVHQFFWVKCVSKYWELILRDEVILGVGWDGIRKSIGRRKAGFSTSICLDSWKWGQK